MAPDPDADLRARVAELEQRVAQQQETIHSMLPGRRSVLKGAALLGGGALVGAGTADRASAQASGQVGTTTDPIDVVAFSIDDRSGTDAFLEVADSGSVTLSSGSATVTANANHSSGSTYYLALGTTENAKISGRVFNDGDLKVELVETGTSVGNPKVDYAVLQVS